MPSPARTTRRAARAAMVLAVTAAVAIAVPPAQAAPDTAPATAAAAQAPAAAPGPAQKPFMGWSSWSMQTSSYPGLNPAGQYSYLTEANVLKQADAMATKLKKYGYEYVNVDAGWWRDQDWTPEFDGYGRQQADPVRFPRGMKPVADDLHRKGLKAGIYLPVGLEKEGYGGGSLPIRNAPRCTTGDIVHSDLRTTNGWDSSYKIDFSRPCDQKYVDSQAQLIAGWGYDFLKLDGVGPGSFKSGDNYDNRADVRRLEEVRRARRTPGPPGDLLVAGCRLRRQLEGELRRLAGGHRRRVLLREAGDVGQLGEGPLARHPPRGPGTRVRAAGTTWTRSTSATARWTG